MELVENKTFYMYHNACNYLIAITRLELGPNGTLCEFWVVKSTELLDQDIYKKHIVSVHEKRKPVKCLICNADIF